ncbi:hypothetical protein B0W81_00610, partial [Prochlorococcus sp. HOT_208_60]
MINSINHSPILIDCTLRDGGYYNKWDFEFSLIEKYLHAISSAGINFVELGFRSQKKDNYFGPLAYCTDNFISKLKIPDTIQIGVMINASEIRESKNFQEIMNNLFPVKASNSKVSLVRIATTLEDIEYAIKAGEWLKNQKYLIGLNLMQIATLS